MSICRWRCSPPYSALPAGASETLFIVARTAGWIAHALEQYGTGRLLRPRARYVGPAPAG